MKPFADRAFVATLPGRRRVEASEDQVFVQEYCDPLLIDVNKILHSKAYRRLQGKAQVFPSPQNPHVRDRLNHTSEVVGLSLMMANMFGLNVNLCHAIALGHDIGHAPLGHAGEAKIHELTGRNFRHEIFSVVIAQKIERKGAGLNLCHEVLEGILYHSSGTKRIQTDSDLLQEFAVVKYADKISYLFADINDFLRYGKDIAEEIRWIDDVFGKTQRTRTNTCLRALYEESVEKQQIIFSESPIAQKFEELKQIMYQTKYPQQDHWQYATHIMEDVFRFLSTDRRFVDCDPAILMALLTDDEIFKITQILMTPIWPREDELKNLGIMEIVPHIRGKNIDFVDPDLDW